MGNLNIASTKFKCQICNEVLTVNSSDSSAYLSKTTHEEFFGMKLETLRVEHVQGNERHINVVLIDHKGLFRGYIDAFIETEKKVVATSQETINVNDLIILGSEIDTINSDDILDCFLLIKNTNWIMEVVRSINMNIKEITRLILAKIDESKKIYHSLPNPLKVTIADLDFQLFIKKDFIIALSSHNLEELQRFFSLAEILSDRYYINPIPPRKRTLKILVNILKNIPVENLDKKDLLRLISYDLFYTNIKTKYPDRIPQIIKSISKRYKVDKEVLRLILSGEKTTIDILEEDIETLIEFKDLMDVIEYVNRRKLLT